MPAASTFSIAEDVVDDGSAALHEPRRKRDRSAKREQRVSEDAQMHVCDPASMTPRTAHFSLDDDNVDQDELNDMYDFSRFVPETLRGVARSAPMNTPREHYAPEYSEQPRLLAKLSARSMRMTRGFKRDEPPMCPKAVSEVTITADNTRVQALEQQLMKRERELNEALEAQGKLLATQRVENARLARQVEQLKGQLQEKDEKLQDSQGQVEDGARKRKQLQLALDAAQEAAPRAPSAAEALDSPQADDGTPEQILNLALVAEQLTDALEESNQNERKLKEELGKNRRALRKEQAKTEELERQVTMTERGYQQRKDEIKQLRLQLTQRDQKICEEQVKKHRLLKVANDANDIDLLLQRGRKLVRVDSGPNL